MTFNASVQASRTISAASNAVIAAIAIAALYFARDVLVPIVLAGLLSFVLTPPMLRLQKMGLGRVPSVAAVTLFSFALLAGFGLLMTSQLAQLADNLPRYQFGIEEKIKSVQEEAINGPLVRGVARILDGLRQPLQLRFPAPVAGPSPTSQSAPEQPRNVVIMRPPAATPFDIASELVSPLIAPFATAGIVVVFVVFILMQREDLRDRLISFAGARDLRRTTIALDDAGARLSRYFLAQTAINAAFGFLVGVGLWLIGVPNFVLWASFAALLRYLPYIGGPLAAICPLFLAAAVDPGWSKLAWTAGLYVVLEIVAGQVVEPLLFGRTAGLSPLAVVAAATFWAWLWGPIGLIMSIPLTLLLVVLGQHVERFSFLAVLFGDASPLTPEESFYHKVVAGHDHEAIEQAYNLQQAQSLAAYYDDVALPGLRLFQSDLNHGLLPPDHTARIVATIDKIIEMANEYEDVSEAEAPESGEEGRAIVATSLELLRPDWRTETPILCIAGRSPFDRSVATMFKQLMASQRIGMRLAPIEAASYERLSGLETHGVAMICLSYLTLDQAPDHTQIIIRRLRRLIPRAKILAGFWTYEDNEDGGLGRLASELGADMIATSLGEAVDICLREAVAAQPAEPVVVGRNEERWSR